jgi:ADP-ribose pyrophosphatase
MAIQKWELLEEVDVSPSRHFPLFLHKVRLPNGAVVDDYYVSKLGDVAMVVPLTAEEELIFVRQYKHGAGEILLEFPAGRIGKKSPEAAARAELGEEAGIVADELIPLGPMPLIVAPSKDSTRTHGFLLKNARVTQSQRLEQTEDIELVRIPLAELDAKIASGEIAVADTIAMIKRVQLHLAGFPLTPKP